jgi:tetratricopeptide (TPR) repeat protein
MGNTEEAISSIQRALQLDPNNPYGHAFQAMILADREDYEEAANESRLAVDISPDLLEVRWARGYVLDATGNPQEAIIEYQAALAINDRIPALHIALGRTYYALEQWDEAIDQFVRADSLNPTDSVPDTFIGQIYLRTGEFGKAVQSMRQAAFEDPTNPNRHGNLGLAFYRNQEPQQALGEFALAIHGGTTASGDVVQGLALQSGQVTVYYYIYGLLLARNGRCAEALALSQQLIAGVPADETAVANAREMVTICEEQVDSPVQPSNTATPEISATSPPVEQMGDQ